MNIFTSSLMPEFSKNVYLTLALILHAWPRFRHSVALYPIITLAYAHVNQLLQ